MKAKILIGVVVLLVLIFGLGSCSTYNGLVGQRNKLNQAWSDVEVQLQRRSDLIPNLAETVKGFAGHEAEVLRNIAESRSRLYNANAPREEKIANDNQLTQTLRSINFLSLQERYPELKANENFKALQYELAGTENRLQVARQDYNRAVTEYNNRRDSFPAVLFAGLLGFPHQDTYFRADEGTRDAPKLKF